MTLKEKILDTIKIGDNFEWHGVNEDRFEEKVVKITEDKIYTFIPNKRGRKNGLEEKWIATEKIFKINGKEINPDYSRKELKDILDQEKAIKICGKSNYTPTDFLKIDDKVFFRNKDIGSETIWYEHPKTADDLLNHLEDMQNEGAIIRIISDKEYFKPFKDPEEDFYVTHNPNEFDYMEYKGYRICYIEDTNTIVIHKIIPNEKESYTDYDETIINRNYTSDNLKRIIDTVYIKENTSEEEEEENE